MIGEISWRRAAGGEVHESRECLEVARVSSTAHQRFPFHAQAA